MWFNFKNVANNNLFFMLIIVIKILINMNTVSANNNNNTSNVNMIFLQVNTSEYENSSMGDTYLTLPSSLPLADFVIWNNTDLMNVESNNSSENSSKKSSLKFLHHSISKSAMHGMPFNATAITKTITATAPKIKANVEINRKLKHQHQQHATTSGITVNELLKTISNGDLSSLSLFSMNGKAEMLVANTTMPILNMQLPNLNIAETTTAATTPIIISERISASAPSLTVYVDDHKLDGYPENMNNHHKRNRLLIHHDDDIDNDNHDEDDEYNDDKSDLGNNGTIKYNRNRNSSLHTKISKKFLYKHRNDSSNNDNNNNSNNSNIINSHSNKNYLRNINTLSSFAWNTFSLRNNLINNNSVIMKKMNDAIPSSSASPVILSIATTTTATTTTTTIAKTIPSVTRISARKVDHTNHNNSNSNRNININHNYIKNNFLLTHQQKPDTPMLNYIFDTYSSANKHHHHDQRYGPHFEDVQRMGQPNNLTAQAGSTIYLNCRISLLQDKTVSWVRRNAQGENALDLLTVGPHTYTGDKRYKIDFQYPSNWRLKITNVKKDDEAIYECQVSTHPPRVIQINLHVNAPKVMIVDEFADPLQEKYYEIDSTLQLSCVIRNVAMSSSVVLWKHGETTLNYDVTRGGVSVKTELMDDGANSTLYIAKISKADSGNYTCSINEYQNYTIAVHILNGESFAELHHSKGDKTIHPINVLIINVILLKKLLHWVCPFIHIDR